MKQNGTEQKRTGRLQFDDLMKELGADTFHRQYVEDTDQEGTAEGFWKWLEAQEDLTFILPTAITGTMADTPFGPYKATDLLALLFWTATGKPECRMTEMDQAVWNWIRKSYKYGLLCEETAAREDWKRLRMALFIGNTPLIAPIIEKGTICSHGECWDRKDLRQILAELKNQNVKRSKAEMASLIWLLAPILDPEAAGLRLFEDPITERLLKQLNAYANATPCSFTCESDTITLLPTEKTYSKPYLEQILLPLAYLGRTIIKPDPVITEWLSPLVQTKGTSDGLFTLLNTNSERVIEDLLDKIRTYNEIKRS